MKASLSALANFSIEVLPTMEMLPDRSVVVSAGAATLLSATVLTSAEDAVFAASAAVSLLPQAARLMANKIHAPTRANPLLCLTLIIMFLHVVCFFFFLITRTY